MTITTVDLLVGLACLVGIVGTIFPIIPGTFLVAGAVAAWGGLTGGVWGWGLALAAVAITALATGVKFLIPARWMRDGGVPNWILLVGAIGGIIGFFMIPVVGLVIGFILAVFIAEFARVRRLGEAWPTTVTAMKAAGLATLIDFSCAVLVTVGWAAVLLAT